MMSHEAAAARAKVRILGTSDLHMHLTGFDYFRDAPDPHIGLSRVATTIKKARAQMPDALCLLFDNGDGLQGTPMEDVPADEAHPLMQAFDALDYDAIGLGNHDFDFGLETLAKAIDCAPCPVLCSNLDWATPPPDELNIAKSVILTRSLICDIGRRFDLKIGVFSVVPPQTLKWNGRILRTRAKIADIVQTSKDMARDLRDRGADIVVALAHTGFGASNHEPGMENALKPLSDLADLDAIIAGHTHLPFPKAGEKALGVPTVLPGFAGSHLGVIDLDLRHDPDTGWDVVRSITELRSTSLQEGVGKPTDEDSDIIALLAPYHCATRKRMDTTLGQTDLALHNYFAGVGADPVSAVVSAALLDWAETEIDTPHPLLTALAPTKCGGRAGPHYYTDIPAGPLKRRHVADLYLYPNQVSLVDISGADLREWLEMSAGWFNQLHYDGLEQLLLDPLRAGHNFDVMHGVKYQIDLSQPARFDDRGRKCAEGPGRIRELTYQGERVTPSQVFTVVSNTYRVMGGGSFPIAENRRSLETSDRMIRDILLERVRDVTGNALPEPAWHFTSMAGVTARLRTGPGAVAHLSTLSARASASVLRRPDGFVDIPIVF